MANPTPLTGGASISDILTAIKNIVTALATWATDLLNINGQVSNCGITQPTVVSTKTGRVASVSIIVGGSASGTIYDSNIFPSTVKPVYVLPTTIGIYVVNMPVSFGVLVVPGSGQTVSVSYS